MNWGSPEFFLAITAVSTGGWLVNNWIRARHGYALEDEWGGKTGHADKAALEAENGELRKQLTRVEDRLQVIERIVTDGHITGGGYDVAAQIEALRGVESLRERPNPELLEQQK